MASTLDRSLQLAMNQVPECVAAGYVDVGTGTLLSVRTVDSHPKEVLDTMSAATADIFQGANVSAIENMFKRARGAAAADSRQYFQEIVIFSENLLHMFLRCKKNVNHVLVVICRNNANVGMVIAKSRMAMASADGLL